MAYKTAAQPITTGSQWFESWFDSIHYHKLYGYRDDTEAARFIDGLMRRLRLKPAAPLLDLGCGAGRHSRYLASLGFQVTGLDLAAGSIQQARKFEKARLRFFEHDMRVPFGKEIYDGVFSFFTSFGYFEARAEHLMVVRNIANSLKSDGRLVLDYLNAGYAETHQIPHESKTIDGVNYRLSRWHDASHFYKRIHIEDSRAGQPARQSMEYVERVAKFTVSDFDRMFGLFGLRIEELYGDYLLNPYDASTSPRLILVVTKLDRSRN